MKQLIFHMAMILMLRRGKTSNLEIKNALHQTLNTDGLFILTQKEVSETMAELANENGWNSELNTTDLPGVAYKEFSLPVAISGITDLDSEDIDDDNIQVITPFVQTAPLVLAPATITVNSGTLDEKDGDVVSYVSGHPTCFKQGFSRRDTRNECFNSFKSLVANLEYDDINTCTTKYFNKHHI